MAKITSYIKNNNPAREKLLPSAQKVQKGSEFEKNKESKVKVVEESKLSELKSSFWATAKADVEKEFEALMKRADDEAIKQDEMLEKEMVQDLENI